MVLHLGSNHRNIYKKILKDLLLQSHLAQIPKIQYVALPSSPLPSLFRWEVLGSNMAPRRGGLGSNHSILFYSIP